MGNRKISSDFKERALRLWNTGWDIEDTQIPWEFLGLVSIAAEHGTINRPLSPIRGQELRILTHALMTAGEDLFAQESDLYLDELATRLGLIYDISILTATLSRNLKEVSLTCKLLCELAVEREGEHRHE